MSERKFIMKSKVLITLVCILFLTSCARMDQRAPRYDENECPFCVPYPGKCFYCDGKQKCIYCKGDGIRITSTKNYPERGIERLVYEEKCPYCNSTGKCRHCEGKGECWSCDGTGRVEEWNFFDKYIQNSCDMTSLQ